MSAGRTNVLQIQTPEGIAFRLWLAGPISRCYAWLIDQAIVFALSTALMILFLAFGAISADFGVAMGIATVFAVDLGYAIVLEWLWRGQTIGKRLCRLRVMDEQGLSLQFSQIVVRNLLRFVDRLPVFYFVGGVWCLIGPRAQRLGDFAASTIVVRHPKTARPDTQQVLGGRYNSFRDHPHLEARLRQAVTPEEAALALDAVLRRDALEADARVSVFAELAEHFRGLAHFPQAATDGLSDERYVRNVVDSIYRAQRQG